MTLDPASAALYALIAVCLFVAGWVVASPLSAEGGSVLAAVAAILIGVGWRIRRRDS